MKAKKKATKKKVTKKKTPLVQSGNNDPYRLQITIATRDGDKQKTMCRSCFGSGETEMEQILWSNREFKNEKEAMAFVDIICYDLGSDGSIRLRSPYKIVEKKAIVERKLVFTRKES